MRVVEADPCMQGASCGMKVCMGPSGCGKDKHGDEHVQDQQTVPPLPAPSPEEQEAREVASVAKQDRALAHALEQSHRVGRMLLKAEDAELAQVQKLADELIASEYKCVGCFEGHGGWRCILVLVHPCQRGELGTFYDLDVRICILKSRLVSLPPTARRPSPCRARTRQRPPRNATWHMPQTRWRVRRPWTPMPSARASTGNRPLLRPSHPSMFYLLRSVLRASRYLGNPPSQ